ncbi:hypothetical protein WJX74_007007 [Apatococcus lobatus]|uniref:Diphthamide biosynthesis protein 3 n=1 Tax=Apatococcus lobatus TaxID=904363 RepID=A0AAW1RZD5_9CHLO
MSYDEVEIEDMDWSDSLQAFTYPCPCGDLFQITKEELQDGEEIASLHKGALLHEANLYRPPAMSKPAMQ